MIKKVKTMRDIQRDLDVTRNQHPISMISAMEDDIKKELEEEFGPFITEEEVQKVAEKEIQRAEKQDLALKKATWNVLRTKEKAKLIQEIRHEIANGRLPNPDLAVKDTMKKSEGLKGVRFNEIIFDY